MKPSTVKAVTGLAVVAVVAVAFFVFGCDEGSLLPLLGAILILSGKEAAEWSVLKNGED